MLDSWIIAVCSAELMSQNSYDYKNIPTRYHQTALMVDHFISMSTYLLEASGTTVGQVKLPHREYYTFLHMADGTTVMVLHEAGLVTMMLILLLCWQTGQPTQQQGDIAWLFHRFIYMTDDLKNASLHWRLSPQTGSSAGPYGLVHTPHPCSCSDAQFHLILNLQLWNPVEAMKCGTAARPDIETWLKLFCYCKK